MALAGDAKQPGIARATALDHLADAPRAEHLELVGRLATDPDPLIRAEAAGYLESLDLRSRVELGWPLLDDPVRSVRLNAALALAPLLNQRLPDQYREQLAARIQEFETAQRVTAERPETQLNLGLMAVAQGRTREAEAAYRKALELDPVFVPASVNLADLYRQMGSDEEGEGMLEEAIRLSPEEPALHHSLGLLQVRRQQLDEALKSLGRAAELAPEHGRYGFVYALALEKAGRVEEAAAVLGRVLEREPGNREVAAALANLRGED